MAECYALIVRHSSGVLSLPPSESTLHALGMNLPCTLHVFEGARAEAAITAVRRDLSTEDWVFFEALEDCAIRNAQRRVASARASRNPALLRGGRPGVDPLGVSFLTRVRQASERISLDGPVRPRALETHPDVRSQMPLGGVCAQVPTDPHVEAGDEINFLLTRLSIRERF